jgi:hypothetical protein
MKIIIELKHLDSCADPEKVKQEIRERLLRMGEFPSWLWYNVEISFEDQPLASVEEKRADRSDDRGL